MNLLSKDGLCVSSNPSYCGLFVSISALFESKSLYWFDGFISLNGASDRPGPKPGSKLK